MTQSVQTAEHTTAAVSEILRQLLDDVLRPGPRKPKLSLQLGAGWTEMSAPPISKLQRRVGINNQRMEARRPPLKIHKVFFLQLLKTRFVDFRDRVYGEAPPYWKLKPTGWQNPELNMTVFLASGRNWVGQKARTLDFDAVWAFDTFEVNLKSPESAYEWQDRRTRVDPDDYSDVFTDRLACPNDRGSFGVQPYLWQRSGYDVKASITDGGAYGTKDIRKLTIQTFLGALLPTYPLPKHSRLYAAERFYTSYN